MATRYRLKRTNGVLTGQRYFSVLDAAGNVVGGAVSGVGQAASSKVGQIAGGLAGMKLAAGAIGQGSALGKAATDVLSGTGFLAPVLGYVAGKSIMKGLGKGLKRVGKSM